MNLRRRHAAVCVWLLAASLGAFGAEARAAAPPLPATWCGTPSVDAASDVQYRLSNAPDIKPIYAHAADRPDQFSTYQDTLQGAIGLMRDKVAEASADTKTLRFDLGTSCGPNYVDFGVIQLPQTAEYYAAGGDGTESSLRFHRDIAALAPSVFPGYRNYLAFGDEVVPIGPGRGTLPQDDSPGAINRANAAGVAATAPIVREFQGGDDEGKLRRSLARLALHEVFHNLGAVQSSAPHGNSGGHCTDPASILCAAGFRTGPCPAGFDAFDVPLDCGADDYFNPAPPAGSYLATHWNIYDSALLCPLAACDQQLTPPQVSLTAARTTARPGERVELAAAGATTYQWSQNGGAFHFGPGATSSATYAVSMGNQPITVVVRGLSVEGAWSEATVTVTPDLSGSPAPAGTGLTGPASPTTTLPTGPTPPRLVRPRISVTFKRTGGRLLLRGRLRPVRPRVPVRVVALRGQRRTSARGATNRGGGFSLRVRPPTGRGRITLRISTSAAPGLSPASRTVRVR